MSPKTTPAQTLRSSNRLINEFAGITKLRPVFDPEYQKALDRLMVYLSSRPLRPLEERRREFIAHVNWKFRLNAEGLRHLYAKAAGIGLTFHYHQKCQIQRAFDLCERDLLITVLKERGIPKSKQDQLLRLFNPVTEKLTLEHLRNECREPSKLRKDKEGRDVEAEIVKAQFSSFAWVSLREREMHRFFDQNFSEDYYRESFWEQLHTRSPHLFNRDNALHIVRLSQNCLPHGISFNDARHATCALVKRLYDDINNYGFLAVIIDPISFGGRFAEWELVADIILYSEKHREYSLKKTYFHWERIRSETLEYIKTIDVGAAQFDLANEGFTYRDCFVLVRAKDRVERLVLLFQKNERDETPIPCPKCRSSNVQGNSYPSLGVRSWECNNLLCPDRSKYNRGKRYTFRGLAMQQAIDDDHNEIPVESVRRWSRDVVSEVSPAELTEMLVLHYSMHGDTIHVHNWPEFDARSFGRNTKHHELKLKEERVQFWDGPFFKRFMPANKKKMKLRFTNLGDKGFQVLLGESAQVLRSFSSGTFDGAVTSPPYYNAREYAQWPNIYCYLHDMFDVAREVFRTLKPGALYLYNVFDYFDNEKTIVFSAMGQRRMILSSYTVAMFRQIGFELFSNVVWDKGEIEGKRGFNAGNFSPYYQSPFNCWEHILVFRKPIQSSNGENGNHRVQINLEGGVLRQKPVMKMVRGENIHGHTAPFPDAIPELLISQLPKGAIVLDPFGGSLTTGRVAERYGVLSVCIERSEQYCRLGLRLRKNALESRRATLAQLKCF